MKEKFNENAVANAMAKTYFLQRKDINDNKPVADILLQWPFLRKSDFILKHYAKLVDHDDETALDDLVENFRSKGSQVYR